jgi:vacuolar-type H+-ATPase subunit E/Vma4
MYKDDKEKMRKLKKVVKKLKENKALVVPLSATSQQIDQMAKKDPTIKSGQQIDIIRK